LIVVAFAQAGCGPGERVAEETLLSYVEAVQSEDLDALFCLSAGTASATELGGSAEQRRSGFQTWANDRYARYLEGRDEGQVPLDGHGIVLVKLFSLGRGTYYRIVGVRKVGEDVLEVDTRLRFGYPELDLSRLSPGTTFYLCGMPPGSVHAVVVPEFHQEVSLEVLDTITVRWTLLHEPAAAGCGERWTVASAETVEGTAVAQSVVWEF
jgi:hypothetical protein